MNWKMDGGKQNERGKMMRRAVGMAGKNVAAGTQPAEQATAGGHSQRILRPAQASTNGHG